MRRKQIPSNGTHGISCGFMLAGSFFDLKSLGEVGEKGEYKLSDAQYEECLRMIQGNMQANGSRDSKRYRLVRGVGVRTRDDRVGSTQYGTERERYNGEGGGRVFKWYSRAVFNSYLSRMGVDERSCDERQCTIALGATSDELRKYPMLMERLVAFSGPQCYPHLDPQSSDYRVRGNEYHEDTKTKDEKQCGPCGVIDSRNWLQCKDKECGKWRCILPAVVGSLRGDRFNHVEASDIDWHTWLSRAQCRYDAVKRLHSHEVAGASMCQDADGTSVSNIAEGSPCADVGGGTRNRLRSKTPSEPWTPKKADVVEPNTPGTPGEILEPEAPTPGTPNTPESCLFGMRTPSDWD